MKASIFVVELKREKTNSTRTFGRLMRKFPLIKLKFKSKLSFNACYYFALSYSLLLRRMVVKWQFWGCCSFGHVYHDKSFPLNGSSVNILTGWHSANMHEWERECSVRLFTNTTFSVLPQVMLWLIVRCVLLFSFTIRARRQYVVTACLIDLWCSYVAVIGIRHLKC